MNAPISMYSYVKFPKAFQISKIVAVIELSPERFCDFFQNVPCSFYTGVCFEKMSLLFLRFFKNFASLLLNSPNSLLLWTSIYSFYSILQVSFSQMFVSNSKNCKMDPYLIFLMAFLHLQEQCWIYFGKKFCIIIFNLWSVCKQKALKIGFWPQISGEFYNLTDSRFFRISTFFTE